MPAASHVALLTRAIQAGLAELNPIGPGAVNNNFLNGGNGTIKLEITGYWPESYPAPATIAVLIEAAQAQGLNVYAVERYGFTRDADRYYAYDFMIPKYYYFTPEEFEDGQELIDSYGTGWYAWPLTLNCACGRPIEDRGYYANGRVHPAGNLTCECVRQAAADLNIPEFRNGSSCWFSSVTGLPRTPVINWWGNMQAYKLISLPTIRYLLTSPSNVAHVVMTCPDGTHPPLVVERSCGVTGGEYGAGECPICFPPAVCSACQRGVARDTLRSMRLGTATRESLLCSSCASRVGPCRMCRTPYLRPASRDRWDYYTRSPNGVCRSCRNEHFNAYNNRSKRSKLILPPEDFKLDSLPYRPTRLMSVETELGGSSALLNQQLYEEGLSPFDSRVGYHPGGHQGLCHIESDGSCDGEMVVQRFLPSDLNDMGRVHRIYELFNNQMNDNTIWLDARCGGHQHIDASQLTMTEVWAAYKVFCHIEDLLYRLGAAWWTAHRTVYGSGYAIPVEKRLNASRAMNNLGHGSGLNLGRFHGNENPRYASGTLEFRLWQSTANYPLLRTQMALTQGLVAAGQHMLRDQNLPTTSRSYRNHHEITKSHVTRLKAQMKWLLTNVPLTDYDRYILLHCAKRAPLGMDAHDIAAFRKIEYAGSTTELRAPSMAMARQGSSYAPQFPDREPGYDPEFAEGDGEGVYFDDEPWDADD